MDKQLNYVRQLFLAIFDKHKGEYDDPSARVRTIIDGVQAQYARFTDRGVLEEALPSDAEPIADFRNLGQFLFLRPTEEGTVPVVSIKSNFKRSWPEVRIRLVLFVLDDTNAIQSIGYRFETPEGIGAGMHNYYHVQPIRQVFREGPAFALTCPAWFPDSHPTWPMDAKDPITLCLSLLVSIYGLTYCMDLIQRCPMANELKQFLRCTNCFTMKEPLFWEVSFKAKKLFFKTHFDRTAFEKFCTETFGAKVAKKPISSEVYYGLANENQLIC